MAGYTGLPDFDSHFDIWGQMLCDSFQAFLHNSKFEISANTTDGTQPPKVLTGSKIILYSSLVDDIPSTAVTENDCYPSGTTGLGYNRFKYIYETSTYVSQWGVDEFTSQANGHYYMFAYDCGSTYIDRFRGKYGCIQSTSTSLSNFGYDNEKGHIYGDVVIDSTTVHCFMLGSFISTGSTVREIVQFTGVSKDRGFINPVILETSSTDATDVVFKKNKYNLNGFMFEMKQDITIQTSANNDWLYFVLNEANGNSTYKTSTGWDTLTTAANNQLNMYSIYDGEYGYCRDGLSGSTYRFFGAAKGSSNSTAFLYSVPIDNYPKTYIRAYISTAQIIASSAVTLLNFNNIDIDVNSELSIGSTFNFYPKKTDVYNAVAFLRISQSSAFLSGKQIQLRSHLNAVAIDVFNSIFIQTNTTNAMGLNGAVNKNIVNGQYLDFRVYQDSTASVTVNASTLTNYLEIRG